MSRPATPPPASLSGRPVYRPKKKSSSPMGPALLVFLFLIGAGGFYLYESNKKEEKKLQEISLKEQEEQRLLKEKKEAADILKAQEEAEKKRLLDEKNALAEAEQEKQDKLKEEAQQKAAKAEADRLAKEEEQKRVFKEEKERLRLAQEDEEDRKVWEEANAERAAYKALRKEQLTLKDPVSKKNPIEEIAEWEKIATAKDKDVPMGTWDWDKTPKNESVADFPGKNGQSWNGSKRAAYETAVSEALTQGAEGKKVVPAFPAAEDFPGIPKSGTPLIERTLTLDTTVGGWHSTGLYAPPGTEIEVYMSSSAIKKGGWRVRIGCHTDGLQQERHPDWHRSPRLTLETPLGKGTSTVSSPFGGLIYLVNGGGKAKDRVTVRIRNAVEAPHYKLGVTSKEEWKRQLETSAAPWGEISSPRIIISLPLAQLKQIPDVESMTAHLQKNMQLQDWLSAFDAVPGKTSTPMRFVVDRQISAGSGHSGYPAMGTIDWGDAIASGSLIPTGSWGLWHELGHNHQQAPFRFDGLGEVTVNLFSLISQMIGSELMPEQAWEGLSSSNQRVFDFISSKKPYGGEGSDAGLQLCFFLHLIEGVRFESFRSVALKYVKDPYNADKLSDEKKWDWFLYELSLASQKDLSDYFELWRVPVSSAGLKRVKSKNLPKWLPDPNYPKNLVAQGE